ncbi:MAG: hypothetical protein HYV09_36815 [Deltaproteobacteria bacterium]|nr:hypothetical protein [Deltaproteobacteria bacterium]
MRFALAVLALVAPVAPSAHAQQAKTAPVTIEVVGAEPVRVRVAVGTTRPCDSDANKPLFNGVVKPGAAVSIPSDAICVCWEQTYAPFTTTGWSTPTVQCRPCSGLKKCIPRLDKPLRIVARSKE